MITYYMRIATLVALYIVKFNSLTKYSCLINKILITQVWEVINIIHTSGWYQIFFSPSLVFTSFFYFLILNSWSTFVFIEPFALWFLQIFVSRNGGLQPLVICRRPHQLFHMLLSPHIFHGHSSNMGIITSSDESIQKLFTYI